MKDPKNFPSSSDDSYVSVALTRAELENKLSSVRKVKPVDICSDAYVGVALFSSKIHQNLSALPKSREQAVEENKAEAYAPGCRSAI